MCATWLERLWAVPTVDGKQDINKLNAPTEQWDQCGVYDIRNGNSDIPYGSKFDHFNNALSFLDWYGMPLMDGFGFIIIDNTGKPEESKSLYQSFMEGKKSVDDICFNNGNRLKTSMMVVAGAIGVALSLH